MNAIEQRFFDLMNWQRARRRVRQLMEATTLSEAARRHSEDMLRRRFFSHTNPDRKTPADRIVAVLHWVPRATAENLWMRSGAISQAKLPAIVEEAVAQLVASRPHRHNIMNDDYTHSGVGVALTSSEFRVTQLFARFQR